MAGFGRACVLGVCALLLLSAVVSASAAPAPSAPVVSAASAVLMDATTGQVLWSRKPDTRRQSASTTKVMTALVALKARDLAKVTTVSKGAALTEGSSMYLAAGEKLTTRELLYGAMLSSGNDASVALAEAVAGTVPKFVGRMNALAKKLGAHDTSFTNPTGLPDPLNCSTARDLACITRYAMSTPQFRALVSTKSADISPTLKGAQRHLTNHNKLLWNYDGADGVKTGYTTVAGKCLVASATREGQQLIAVVLGSSNIWLDSVAMLNFGFGNYALVRGPKAGEVVKTIGQSGRGSTPLRIIADRELVAVVSRSAAAAIKKVLILQNSGAAPVHKGERLGAVELKGPDGKVYASSDLVAANTVLPKPRAHALWTALLNVIRVVS